MPSYSLVMKNELNGQDSMQSPQNIQRPMSIRPETMSTSAPTKSPEATSSTEPDAFHRTLMVSPVKLMTSPNSYSSGGAS